MSGFYRNIHKQPEILDSSELGGLIDRVPEVEAVFAPYYEIEY